MDTTLYPDQVWINTPVGDATPDYDMIMNLGHNWGVGTPNSHFYIKDLAIWDKSLSDAECLEIYNSGSLIDLETVTAASNLKAWFDFNENTHPDPQSNSDIVLSDKLGNHPDIGDSVFMHGESSFNHWEFSTNIPNG